MIKIIYGSKGSGKTKQIIDMANSQLQSAKGNNVFLTDTKRYMFDIHRNIRFVNTTEYPISCTKCTVAFLCGMIAGNSDIETVYIDGIARICNCSLDTMKDFFVALEKMSADFEVNFVLTISCDEANLPEFIKKYNE